jgi:flagellar hook assembly protein FlgD
MAEVTGLDLSKPWLTAYPNPTRLGLNISYNITGTAPTRLRVYDATGKVVTSLWDATRSRGQYVTRWSGLAANGRQVPAGIYFIKLESGDTRLTQKLVIQR